MMMTIMMKATNVTIRLSKSKEGAARRQDGENSRRWKISILDLILIYFQLYSNLKKELPGGKIGKTHFFDGKVIC